MRFLGEKKALRFDVINKGANGVSLLFSLGLAALKPMVVNLFMLLLLLFFYLSKFMSLNKSKKLR